MLYRREVVLLVLGLGMMSVGGGLRSGGRTLLALCVAVLGGHQEKKCVVMSPLHAELISFGFRLHCGVLRSGAYIYGVGKPSISVLAARRETNCRYRSCSSTEQLKGVFHSE